MKVQITLETARVAISLVGPSANRIVSELVGGVAKSTDEVFSKEGVCSITVGSQEKGYLVVGPPEQLIKSWTMIQSGVKLAGPDQWTLFEMRSGLARITAATQDNFIPQSVNLDLIGGVSFSKGCYPGQEIVARVRYLGRLKHRMARALVTQGELPVPGDSIYLGTETTQRAGTIINSVDLPSGTGELLTTVPLSSSTGSEFSVDRSGRSIRLVEVPQETSSDKLQ